MDVLSVNFKHIPAERLNSAIAGQMVLGTFAETKVPRLQGRDPALVAPRWGEKNILKKIKY